MEDINQLKEPVTEKGDLSSPPLGEAGRESEVRAVLIEELSKAGIDPALEEKLRLLEKRRITPETQIEKRRFLFRMFGKPCFPRGELVAITGKKKCGKTYLCSLLMTLCARREAMSMQRMEEEPLKALWIDTEQSEESTQEILTERITPMVMEGCENTTFPKEQYDVFNLRPDNWNERLPLIEMAARQSKPDLIILDGIRDVVNDINDIVMAQEVLERLMHIANDLGCCICCVLHQNKAAEDKTLRGALGTELGNKCFEEYECKKDAEHRIFQCQQVATRKYDIMEKFMFTIQDNGLPRLLSSMELSAFSEGNAEKNRTPTPQRTYNPEYVQKGEVNYAKAFNDLLPEGTEMRACQLEQEFMELVGIYNDKRYGFIRKKALDEGIIQKREEGYQKVFYFRGPKLDEPEPF